MPLPTPPADPGPQVVVRRSARRRRTVSAHREGDTVVVLLPARMSRQEEEHWVREMLARIARAEARRPAATRSDAELLARCAELSQRWLRGRAAPGSVRWVPPMRTRWASCSPADASIRVSERLQVVPGWVLDYVLVHELAHLLVPGHGPEFWAWVDRYPRTERARGYLEGLSAAAALGIEAPSEDAEAGG